MTTESKAVGRRDFLRALGAGAGVGSGVIAVIIIPY